MSSRSCLYRSVSPIDVRKSRRISFCSDSKYVMDGLSKGWAKGWRARGWVKSDKKPALNSDLWAHLLDLCEGHTIHYNWVKGHAGHPENERCDELAVQAAAQPSPRRAARPSV